jgi:uncharacterized DUF497 family protein
MLRFAWDPVKVRTDQRKHGVTFEDAMHVFLDPGALSRQDRVEGGELRWQTIGLAGGVHRYWSPTRSARRAPKKSSVSYQPVELQDKERTRYEQSRPKDVL